MKTNTFRNVRINMERANMYGHYYISAHYRGKDIKVLDTDSEAWDWLDDDSNVEKYNNARRHCYNKIREEYNNL